MDTSIIVAGIIGLLLQYLIVVYAVHNATSIMREQSKIQTALLTELARKAGVSEEDIQNALTLTK